MTTADCASGDMPYDAVLPFAPDPVIFESAPPTLAYLVYDSVVAMALALHAPRDPRDGGQAELAAVRALYESGRHEAVLERLEHVLAPERSDVASRARDNARALAAMSLFRTGRTPEARLQLEQQLAEAESSVDPARIGGLCINLATVERRAGDIALREHGIDALNRLAMAGGPLAQGLRGLGLGVMHDVAPLRRGLMRLRLRAARLLLPHRDVEEQLA